MINIFGSNYDEIGSTNKNLILKTQGKIKIQWGKKFIDLIDNDGNINSKLLKLINKVNSLDDISKDGFYIYDGSLYVKYGDDILPLLNLDSDALYVSFVTELETTSELKYTALKNLGLVYPTLSNVNNIPTNGIIYNEYDKSLYIIDNSVLSKYYLEIPNPYTKLFVIAKEDGGNGALVINGEGIENSLYFNDLQIYNQQAYAYYKSLKDHKFFVGGLNVVNITGSGVETNEIQSKGATSNNGYMITQEGSDYILYIDDIHVRNGIKAEAIKNIIPVRIYKEENVITESKIISGPTDSKYTLNLYFKYPDTYLDEDILRIYIEAPYEEVNKVYPIDLKVTQSYTNDVPPVKLNYVVVEYTIDNNHPNNVLEYINNTVCYLYSRKTQTGVDTNDDPIYALIINEDLVIGDLSGYNASHTGYGIISKNNKFYSAIFDKNKDIVEQDETYKNGLFPVYSQELYDRLKLHYDDQNYEKVIPPLGIINELNKNYYVGECRTTGSNLIKTITLIPITTLKFNIRAGTILKVIFYVDNTYDATVELPVEFIIKYNERPNPEDLNENIYDYFPSLNTSTPVYYMNTIKLGTSKNVYGENGKAITYIYDGTYWNWLSGINEELKPLLKGINNLLAQSLFLPKDDPLYLEYNSTYDGQYHRDYILAYAKLGTSSGTGNYVYRWIPIIKLNTDDEIPPKGIIIYDSTELMNKIKVISPGTDGQYLKCTILLNDIPQYSWDSPTGNIGLPEYPTLTDQERLELENDIYYALTYIIGYEGNDRLKWNLLYDNNPGIIYNISTSANGTIKPGYGYLKNEFTTYKWELFENIDYLKSTLLIFDIISDGYITFTKNANSGYLKYYINNQSTSWNNVNGDIYVSEGNKLFFKGDLLNPDLYYSIGTFSGTAEFNVSGNIIAITGNNLYYYAKLFEGCLNIRSAKNLYLPDATNNNTYNSLFYGSTVNYVKVCGDYDGNKYNDFVSINQQNEKKILIKPSNSTGWNISGWKILTYEEEKLNDLLPKTSGSGYILTTDNDGMWKIVQNLTLVNNNP